MSFSTNKGYGNTPSMTREEYIEASRWYNGHRAKTFTGMYAKYRNMPPPPKYNEFHWRNFARVNRVDQGLINAGYTVRANPFNEMQPVIVRANQSRGIMGQMNERPAPPSTRDIQKEKARTTTLVNQGVTNSTPLRNAIKQAQGDDKTSRPVWKKALGVIGVLVLIIFGINQID